MSGAFDGIDDKGGCVLDVLLRSSVFGAALARALAGDTDFGYSDVIKDVLECDLRLLVDDDLLSGLSFAEEVTDGGFGNDFVDGVLGNAFSPTSLIMSDLVLNPDSSFITNDGRESDVSKLVAFLYKFMTPPCSSNLRVKVAFALYRLPLLLLARALRRRCAMYTHMTRTRNTTTKKLPIAMASNTALLSCDDVGDKTLVPLVELLVGIGNDASAEAVEDACGIKMGGDVFGLDPGKLADPAGVAPGARGDDNVSNLHKASIQWGCDRGVFQVARS